MASKPLVKSLASLLPNNRLPKLSHVAPMSLQNRNLPLPALMAHMSIRLAILFVDPLLLRLAPLALPLAAVTARIAIAKAVVALALTMAELVHGSKIRRDPHHPYFCQP